MQLHSAILFAASIHRLWFGNRHQLVKWESGHGKIRQSSFHFVDFYCKQTIHLATVIECDVKPELIDNLFFVFSKEFLNHFEQSLDCMDFIITQSINQSIVFILQKEKTTELHKNKTM